MIIGNKTYEDIVKSKQFNFNISQLILLFSSSII